MKVNCDAPAGASRCYNNQGPRRPGEVLRISALGVHDVKWFSEDIKGNREAVKTQRFLIAADQENGTPGGNVPATLSLGLGTPATSGRSPGRPKDYKAGTTASVISTAGNATLSVSDPSPTATGRLVNGTFSLPQALQATRRAWAGPARVRPGRRLGQPDQPADVQRPGQQRRGDAELQADDRRERRPPHGHLRQDAHVHAEHD